MAVDIYGGHGADLRQIMSESAYALCAAADSIKKPLAAAMFTGGRPRDGFGPPLPPGIS